MSLDCKIALEEIPSRCEVTCVNVTQYETSTWGIPISR